MTRKQTQMASENRLLEKDKVENVGIFSFRHK